MGTRQISQYNNRGINIERWAMICSFIQAFLVICAQIAVIVLVNVFLTRTSAPEDVSIFLNVLFGLVLLSQPFLVGLSLQACRQKNSIGLAVKDIFNALGLVIAGVQIDEIGYLKALVNRVIYLADFKDGMGYYGHTTSDVFPPWYTDSISKALIQRESYLVDSARTMGVVVAILIGIFFVIGAYLTYLTSQMQEWKVIKTDALTLDDRKFVWNYNMFMGLIQLQVYFGISIVAIAVLNLIGIRARNFFKFSGTSESLYALILFAAFILMANYPCGYYGVHPGKIWTKALFILLNIGNVVLVCTVAAMITLKVQQMLAFGWVLGFTLIQIFLTLAVIYLMVRMGFRESAQERLCRNSQ